MIRPRHAYFKGTCALQTSSPPPSTHRHDVPALGRSLTLPNKLPTLHRKQLEHASTLLLLLPLSHRLILSGASTLPILSSLIAVWSDFLLIPLARRDRIWPITWATLHDIRTLLPLPPTIIRSFQHTALHPGSLSSPPLRPALGAAVLKVHLALRQSISQVGHQSRQLLRLQQPDLVVRDSHLVFVNVQIVRPETTLTLERLDLAASNLSIIILLTFLSFSLFALHLSLPSHL